MLPSPASSRKAGDKSKANADPQPLPGDHDEEDDNDGDEGPSSSSTGPGGKGGSGRADARPFFKALLLCGPPGTGKTTLAHVVAKHCGYRPLEINASDDRSHDVLKDSLLRAMHGNTVYGDRQPNCIILDEIDGIDGKNAIDMLVRMIKAPLRSKGLGGSGSGPRGKAQAQAQGGTATPLTRPLICICNDQYAPSLRELRKVAKIFVFRPPGEQRLVARLKTICALEKILSVSPQALSALSAATGHDIRSSINTCLLYTSPSPRDRTRSRMPSSA